jgi:NADH-quinone oxidoreductase subunit G
MPTLSIEGREITVPDGTTVLEAARQLGFHVPTFCYHPGLSIAGNCRMCLVEIEKQPRLAASCAMPVADGMVVHLESEKAKSGRKAVIEFLLANHPLDCPICDRAGECTLQDNSMNHGLMKSRFGLAKVHKPKVQDIGPHVVLDAERCIMCTRCVRFVNEVSGSHELGIFGRGNTEQIGLAPGVRLDNPYSGNVVDLCPVGALTAKEFRFQSRPWFLEKTESVCPSCARGCSITIETNTSRINKVGRRRVYRFLPRHNPEVNDYWMCDEGRYRFGWIDEGRVVRASRRGRGDAEPEPLSLDNAVAELKRAVDAVPAERVGVLLSRGSSLEDLYLARELWRGPWKGVRVAADAPNDRPPTEDTILRLADKWPNTAGAQLLGFDLAGSNWVEIVEAAARGELDVLIVVGHDLARIYPSSQVDAALHHPAHVIVLAQNVTSTAARATLTIPVATFAERDGVFINAAGRAQRFAAALPPLGDAVPEWRVWRDVLGRYGSPWLVDSAAAIFAAAAAAEPALAGLSHEALGPHGRPVRGAAAGNGRRR